MWDGEKIHKLNKFRRCGSIKVEVTLNNVSHPLHQNSGHDWEEREAFTSHDV